MIELIADHAERVICRPVGELDTYSADEFLHAVSDVTRTGADLEIDLMLVTFLDLTGARAILSASRYVSSRGTATRVVGGTEGVRRMLDVVMDGQPKTPA